ncbi:MAG: hypothetical protein ACTSWY_09455 [Promethearchaeota archaeon]
MILGVAEKFMDRTDITLIVVGIECVIIAFCFFFTALFYAKIKRRKEYELRNDTAQIWMVFFFSQGCMYILNVFANFFQDSIPKELLSREYLLNLAGVLGLVGLIFIAKKSEDILQDYFITTLILSFISVFPVLFFYFPYIPFIIFQAFSYITIIIIFYAAVRYKIGEHKLLNRQLGIFIIGFIVMAIAQLFRSDVILEMFCNINENYICNVRLLSDGALLASLFMLQYAFVEFPSLFELEWRKHLHELHVVYLNGGLEILSHFFKDGKKDLKIHSEIVGGFLYGVNQLITEITGSKTSLNMIKQQENVIIFEKNETLIIFLIAGEYNEIYKLKLKKLLSQIMIEYGHILENWKGNKTVLKPIRQMVEKIFK